MSTPIYRLYRLGTAYTPPHLRVVCAAYFSCMPLFDIVMRAARLLRTCGARVRACGAPVAHMWCVCGVACIDKAGYDANFHTEGFGKQIKLMYP